MILQNEIWLDSIDSTNEEAKRLIDAGHIDEPVFFIVTDEQTQGKGTRGRTWVSPKGAGIYLSVVHVIASPRTLLGVNSAKQFRSLNQELDWDCFVANAPCNDTLFTRSAGIACVEAIKEIYHIETKLKPVNDIYASGKKLGGILVETRLKENKLQALITGIGINILKVERKIEDMSIEPISIEELISDKTLTNLSKEILIKKIVEKVIYFHKQVFENRLGDIESKWEKYKLHVVK